MDTLNTLTIKKKLKKHKSGGDHLLHPFTRFQIITFYGVKKMKIVENDLEN